MSIHLTKEELQECQRASWEGEESTTKVGDFLVWMDYDERGYVILYYEVNNIPYLQGKGKWTTDGELREGKCTFLEGIDFEPYDNRQVEITLSISELEDLEYDRGTGRLKGWSIETHTDTGDFNAEKGAMTDFEVSLYDEDRNYMGSGTGHNYYNASAGVHFYESITFKKPEPPTVIEEFDESIINAVQSISDMKTKIWKMKQLITKYESSL